MDASSSPDPHAGLAAQQIVVVGSINADLVVRVSRHPHPGETLHGSGGELLPGGKGANQAVAAALLDGRVTMVGAVGNDPQAEAALTGLRTSGADLSHVRTADGPTGLAVVTVAEGGENAIIVIPGANGTVDADDVARHADALRDAAVLVLQGEIPRSGIEQAARMVRGNDRTRLILNPAPVLDLDPDVVRQADPLVVNEHEAELVLGQFRHVKSRENPAAQAAAQTPEDLILALHEVGIHSVVLTLGAAGALIIERAEDASEPGPRPVRVPAAVVRAVDTTGAGDAFIGALAVQLAADASLEDAARYAARVSAFAVRGMGAQPSYARTGDSLPALP